MDIVRNIETQRLTVLPNDVIDDILCFHYKIKIQEMLRQCKTIWSNTIHHVYGKKIFHVLVHTLDHGHQQFNIESNIFCFRDTKRKDSYASFLTSSTGKNDAKIEFRFEGYTLVLVPLSHSFTQCNLFIIPHDQTKKQIVYHTYSENPLYHKLRWILRNFIYFLFLVKQKLGILRKREKSYIYLTGMLQELLYLFLFAPDQVLAKMNVTFVDHVGDANLYKRMMKSVMNAFKDASIILNHPLFAFSVPNSKV